MQRCFVLYFLVALSAYGLGEAQAQPKDALKKDAPKYARFMGKGAHWLHIFSDGSGMVGYGAGGDGFQGRFKVGTFEVGQITDQLKRLPSHENGDREAHFFFSLNSERKAPDQPGPLYSTRDRKLIPSLFDRAYRASGQFDKQGLLQKMNG